VGFPVLGLVRRETGVQLSGFSLQGPTKQQQNVHSSMLCLPGTPLHMMQGEGDGEGVIFTKK